MLQQQAQQQVLIRFVVVGDQKRQVPFELPPVIERMLALPELRPVEIQPRSQFAVQIYCIAELPRQARERRADPRNAAGPQPGRNPTGGGRRFPAMINHMEYAYPENDSRHLPALTPWTRLVRGPEEYPPR